MRVLMQTFDVSPATLRFLGYPKRNATHGWIQREPCVADACVVVAEVITGDRRDTAMKRHVFAVLAAVVTLEEAIATIDRQLPERGSELYRIAADRRMPEMKPVLIATLPAVKAGRERIVMKRRR